MRLYRALRTMAAVVPVVVLTAACAQRPPVATERTLAERVAESVAAGNGSPALYGDLENLDPSGQMLTFWHPHTRAREELLLAMIDDFNAGNVWRIVVQAESKGGCGEVYQAILAGRPTGQLPNLVAAQPGQAAAYVAQDILVELDPYVNSPRWGYNRAELADFFSTVFAADALPQSGGRYVWPVYKSMDLLYYNADWLTELGFSGPPETWEAFEGIACKAAQVPFSGAAPDVLPVGFAYTLDTARFASLVASRGGSMVSPDATAYELGGAAGVETLVFLQDMASSGCAAQATELDGDQAAFVAGTSLFYVGSSLRIQAVQSAVSEGVGFRWSVSPLPHATSEPVVSVYGASQAIVAATPEQQLAAWLFLKWFGEPEQQARWVLGTGYHPVRRAAVDLLAGYTAENPVYGTALTFIALTNVAEPPIPGYDECQVAVNAMLPSALDGTTDAATALANTVDACNQTLANPDRP